MAMKLKKGVTVNPDGTIKIDSGVQGVSSATQSAVQQRNANMPQQGNNDPYYKTDTFWGVNSTGTGQQTGGQTGQPNSVSDILGSMGEQDPFITDYYKNLQSTATGAIDEDAIRRQKEAEYQAQIDSVNRLYADKLNQARIQGQGRLGSSTAMQARGGLLGSDFGAAQTSNVQGYNTQIENSVEAERQSALNDIFAEIRTNATAEIAAKRAAKEAGAKEYLQYLAGATERKATKHQEAARKLLAKGIDPKSVSDAELTKLGLTRDDLTIAYNDLKSGAESAALKASQEQETYDLTTQKTKAEIEKLNREASKNYEVGGIIYNAKGEQIGIKKGNNYEAGGKIYEAGTNNYLGDAVKPGTTGTGVTGAGGTGFVPGSSGMRTDRHNNPVAMTTDVAKTLGLVEGVDYTKGDAFPNNPNLFTARLIGDGLQTTIKALDNAANDPNKSAFTTQSGQPRWTYINMSDQDWLSKTPEEKAQVIAGMYQKEGGNGQFTQGGTGGLSELAQSVQKGIITIAQIPSAQRAAVAAELAQAGTQSPKTRELQNSLDLVDSLLSDEKALKSISGWWGGRLPGSGIFSNQLAANQFDQLKGILSLGEREKLKGTGAISDYESKLLANSASALGRNLSEEDFKAELEKIREILSGKYKYYTDSNAPASTAGTPASTPTQPSGDTSGNGII